jgi:hypothetical protein
MKSYDIAFSNMTIFLINLIGIVIEESSRYQNFLIRERGATSLEE